MTDCSLTGLACFEPGLSISERGRRAVLLTRALSKVYDARHLAQLLGDPSDASRMAQALAAINALPSRSRREVIASYLKLSKTQAAA